MREKESPARDALPSMRLRAFAKLWECEGEFYPDGPNSVHVFEPLDVHLPETARPSCHLGNRVAFYSPDGTGKLAEVEHLALGGGAHPHLVHLSDGIWYEIVSGSVQWHATANRWCMRWWARRNTRAAKMANAGYPSFRS